MGFKLVVMVGALTVVACVTAPVPGSSVSEHNWTEVLSSQVQFDYACAPDLIRVVRTSGGLAPYNIDVDVCGSVRRYRYTGFGWLDVTSLYPPSALPAPLPPK